MSSNLSQWEIDQLLRSMSDGQTAEVATPPPVVASDRSLRPYDLHQPNRFSKDHLRTLQEIHEQFARGLGPTLSSYLRLTTRAQLTTVEEMTLGSFLGQLTEPTLVVVTDLTPLEYPVSLTLSLAPTLIALDRLCGGPGFADERRQTITKIEQSILNPLIRLLVQSLADAWSTIISVQPAIVSVSPPGATVRLGQDHEAAAVFTMELSVGGTSGTLSVGLPFLTIQAIADQLHSKIWDVRSKGPRVVHHQDQITNLLLDVPSEVSVLLGSADVPASELLNLREGDVIQLGTPIHAELDLTVEECRMFRCRPGVAAGRLAVKVISVCADPAPILPPK